MQRTVSFSITSVLTPIPLQTSIALLWLHGSMAERKRKHYDDDDDDEMDTVPTRQRNSHGAVYLTSTGAVTQLEMGVSWKDQYLERLFEDSVTFATDFGAQMAVGVVNGRDPNTVYWYRHIGDMEPVEITGWPALDIVRGHVIHSPIY